jgi:DNA polymerase III delta prime subunit
MVNMRGAQRAVAEFSKPGSGIHAVLFYGVKGAGKRALADRLAKAWLTEGDDDSPPARSFDHGNNPDYLIVQPQGLSRNIKVGQITDTRGDDDFEGVPIGTFIRTSPLVSKKKVVLIEDADRLLGPAFNALLKSLEEPEPHVRYILTTTQVGAIAPTILSRCIAVACEIPPSPADDPMWVLAEGSPGRYEDILRHESVYRAIWQFAEHLPGKSREGGLLASEVLRSIADALQKATEQGVRSANADTLELLAVAIRHLHPSWHEARTEISEAHRRVLRNGNAGLVYDAMLAKLLG